MKNNKGNWNQGEKQIKIIQNQGEIKTINKYGYSDTNSPLISNQKEIFNKLVEERLEEIAKLDKKVNLDNLIYRYKGSTANEKFNKFDNAFSLLDKIREGGTSLADTKNDQTEFKSNLSKTKHKQQTNKQTKSKEQRNTLHNNEMLHKARNIVIKCFDDYSSIVSEAKYEATKGKGLKI